MAIERRSGGIPQTELLKSPEQEKLYRGNEVYVGPPGVGKTSQSERRAKRTGKTAIHIDDIIEERTGMTIKEIFDNPQYGEPFFRKLETNYLEEFLSGSNRIIDTGGGIFETPENLGRVLKNGIMVYYEAPAEVATSRVEGDSVIRPGLTDKDVKRTSEQRIQIVSGRIERRRRFYERADIIIHTSGLNEDEVEEITDREIKAFTLDSEHKRREYRPRKRNAPPTS